MKIVDVPQTGKLGLTVTYPGRNGLIRRTKVTPKNPNTSAQIAQRSILRQCAMAYDQLTDVQQAAWIVAAAAQKSRPTLGQSGPLTGLQLYVKVNAALMTIGAATVSAPPALPAPVNLPVTGFVITNTGDVVALKLTTSDAPPDGTMLWGCAPEKSGVRRVIGPRYLGTLDSPANGGVDITTPYTGRFGVPPVGSRVFVQVNTNDSGYEGLRHTFSARVPVSS
jgi:hypothetical protein